MIMAHEWKSLAKHLNITFMNYYIINVNIHFKLVLNF